MPIRPHLKGQKFDPETIRVMGLAFEMALVALRLADRGDLAKEILADKIIELAKAGERDPERLCEGIMKGISRGAPSSDHSSQRTQLLLNSAFAASREGVCPSVRMSGGLVSTTPCNDQKNRTSSGKPLRS